MTDLLQVLPDLDTRPHSHLLPSLDKALISTADLVVLEPAHVAKRAQLPPADVRRLIDAVVAALHRDLGFGGEEAPAASSVSAAASGDPSATGSGERAISTLDAKLDAALGGGIRAGYLVEVTGESGAGKTQLLLTLLLASQLPPPLGLAKSAVYISTEAALATSRLTQLLAAHPSLAPLPPAEKPSLSRILSIQTPDLESQDHILRYQLPVAIKKHNVGLVVLDSVAANYRAEFEKHGATGAAAMAKRGAQLVQLGALLRDLARTEAISVVVANQVADRFTRAPSNPPVSRAPSANSQTRPRTTNTPQPAPPHPDHLTISPDALTLDHQQRWFTGWGDLQSDPAHTLKTPSLGLVWTNQIACRIALHKRAVFATRPLVVTVDGRDQLDDDNENHVARWRRWFKVVFAPWAPPTEGRGIEYEVRESGIAHVD